MKHLPIVLGLALLAPSVHAQNVLGPDKATVLAYWNKGDVKTYRLERKKSGRSEGSSTVLLDIKVLASTDTTYTVECVYRDMMYTGEMPEDRKAAEAMGKVLRAVDGMRVVVETTETGILKHVTNSAEIKRHTEKLMKSVVDLAPPAEREQMKAMFGTVITEEALTVTATEDLGYLLYPFGVEYVLGKTETFDTELPNPFGGPALPGKVELRMTSLKPDTERATIQLDQRIDPSGLGGIIEQLVSALGEDMEPADIEEMKRTLQNMRITDRVVFDLDLRGAWITSAKCIRTVSMDAEEHTDQRIYTLL